MLAVTTTGCTPPQEHMSLVEPNDVPRGSPVSASVGADLGPDMRDLVGLRMLVAPLVDRGSRQWDDMPSNIAAGRVLPGSVAEHTFVSEPTDLAPGDYAVWFQWGADGGEHTDGYDLLRILP